MRCACMRRGPARTTGDMWMVGGRSWVSTEELHNCLIARVVHSLWMLINATQLNTPAVCERINPPA
jgi:hypothetical protein